MSMWAVIAAVIGWITLARTRATATIGTTHLVIPALWLAVALVVLALAAAVLLLWRVIMRDGGLWLTPKTEGTS